MDNAKLRCTEWVIGKFNKFNGRQGALKLKAAKADDIGVLANQFQSIHARNVQIIERDRKRSILPPV